MNGTKKKNLRFAFVPVLILVASVIGGGLLTGCDVEELLGSDDDENSNNDAPSELELVGQIANFLLRDLTGGAMEQYTAVPRDFPDGVPAEYDPASSDGLGENPQELTITVTLTDAKPDPSSPEMSVSGDVVITVDGENLSEPDILLFEIASKGSITSENHPGGIQAAAIDGAVTWPPLSP